MNKPILLLLFWGFSFSVNSSSSKAWQAFHQKVNHKCSSLIKKHYHKILRVNVIPYGSKSYGIATIEFTSKKTIVCIYNKKTKLAELTPIIEQ